MLSLLDWSAPARLSVALALAGCTWLAIWLAL